MIYLAAEAVRIHPPPAPLRGSVRLPGSKSITNRALLIASLAMGRTMLTGALKSDDTLYMAEALRRMGVVIEEPDANSFLIMGNGGLRAPDGPLFLGNAGTATRFLTAAAALVGHPVMIDGDAHMRKRPIQPLLDALSAWGVDVVSPTGSPPVTVHGRGLGGGRLVIDAGLSSQYVSALLMVASMASGDVEIGLAGAEIGARGYIALTSAVMEAFGARVDAVGDGTWQVAPTGYRATDFAIEPDASAATYFWAAQALAGGIVDIGLQASAFTQPDAAAYAFIAAFPDMPSEIDGAQFQDAVPTLAALAALNNGPVRFRGIANLRVKECDRIAALTTELNRIQPGLAREDGDELLVAGQPALSGETRLATIETYNDHRIAMAMALIGLRVEGLTILHPGCVAKTYPNYWQAMHNLGVGVVFVRGAAKE